MKRKLQGSVHKKGGQRPSAGQDGGKGGKGAGKGACKGGGGNGGPVRQYFVFKRKKIVIICDS
jgi:hypothetical protein